MVTRKILAAIVLAGATLVPVASFADEAGSAQPCILREHHITAVAPYRIDERRGRFVYQRLAGAEVTIQAEPGLTAEWLRLTLGRHLSEMGGSASMKDCAFSVDDVRIEVDSAGAGFSVKLIARNSDKAEEVLRRARLLHG